MLWSWCLNSGDTATICGKSRIAIASSYVICFRVSISVVGRCPNTGKRNTNSTFDPSDCTRFSTLEFSPFTTDEITITVITPITIPRIVNPLRSLFSRSVSSAIVTVSPMLPIAIRSA